MATYEKQGTITNPSGAGIRLLAGGHLFNGAADSALIAESNFAAAGYGAAGIVVNDGTLINAAFYGQYGVFLRPGGTVVNRGMIGGDRTGVAILGSDGPNIVLNQGSIVGGELGIRLDDGGRVINSGWISGGSQALNARSETRLNNSGTMLGSSVGIGISNGSVIKNSGTIGVTLPAAGGLYGLSLGGSGVNRVFNEGLIVGGGGDNGRAIFSTSDLQLVNTGTVMAQTGILATNAATVYNAGTISGTGGSAIVAGGVPLKLINRLPGRIASDGAAAVNVYSAGGTITNAGAITGSNVAIHSTGATDIINRGLISAGSIDILLDGGSGINTITEHASASLPGFAISASPGCDVTLTLAHDHKSGQLDSTRLDGVDVISVEAGASWSVGNLALNGTARIDIGSGGHLTMRGAVTTPDSLQVASDGVLSMRGGSLNIGGAGAIPGDSLRIDPTAVLVASGLIEGVIEVGGTLASTVGGMLEIRGDIFGAGTISVSGNSLFAITDSGNTSAINFNGQDATLDIARPTGQLFGIISGFSGSDAIDLRGVGLLTFADLYATDLGHTLNADTPAGHVSLYFSEAFTSVMDFSLTADAHGGTILGYHPST